MNRSSSRIASATASLTPLRRGRLGLVQLTAATYLMVSGGPFGLEDLVHDSGYRFALLILFLVPLFWSLPVGLMVGELAAAIPAEGGFYVWVRRAMGPFWGFQEAWLSLAASVFDMAAYPALFVLSLGRMWPPAVSGHNGLLIEIGFVVGCVIWNLCGAKSVGEGSVVLAIALLAPFFLISVFAFLHRVYTPAGVTAGSATHRDILAAIVVAMWNYMGWDNASTVAAEVEAPQRTYPRVMLIALALIVASYVVPILAVQAAGIPPADWATGSWVSIGAAVSGPWLGLAVLIATTISTLGTFNSLTMSYSRVPFAMAEDRHLPRALTRTLASGAPWVSLIACGLAWIFALGLTFDRLLMLDILLYGLSLILEFIALVILRVREPGLHRPFRVPGGLFGAAAAGIGPTVLLICAAVRTHEERIGNISALALGAIIVVAGAVAWLPARVKAARSR